MLPTSLAESAIDYEHIGLLGGLRAKSATVPPSLNAFWQNSSFHNYADYAMSEDFNFGLTRLANWAKPSEARSCAQMQFGGDVIAESSQTIYSLAEMRCSTFSDGVRLSEHA
jgi:hypothetical protein